MGEGNEGCGVCVFFDFNGDVDFFFVGVDKDSSEQESGSKKTEEEQYQCDADNGVYIIRFFFHKLSAVSYEPLAMSYELLKLFSAF